MRFPKLFSVLAALALTGCASVGSPVFPDTPTDAFAQESVRAEDSSSSTDPLDIGLVVHFIDVGQGDSILLESDNHFMLVDAGENDQADTVISYLENAGVCALDYVVGTHPHSDHIGGLDKVIEHFDVSNVILPPVEHTTRTFEDVLDAVEAKDLKITRPKVGDTRSLGRANFTILAPNDDYGKDLNDWSVGLRVTYGDNRFVMCGDAETLAEADMLKNGIDLSADVLKLGHHGSSTSSSPAFLDAVNPSVAIISCGQGNSYGHPHRETMEKLSERNITVYRTDEDGSITAACDGENIIWGTESAGTRYTPSSSLSRPAAQTYVLNTNSKKFHLSDCPAAARIKEENRGEFSGNRQELLSQGYAPCGQCNP